MTELQKAGRRRPRPVRGRGDRGASLREDLVDEFHLFTHPVVLGGGRPLFSPLERRLPVRLVEATTFEPGVVLLRHERVR